MLQKNYRTPCLQTFLMLLAGIPFLQTLNKPFEKNNLSYPDSATRCSQVISEAGVIGSVAFSFRKTNFEWIRCGAEP